MRTTLKNLWNRRRSNLWLFIELILVTVLSWIIIDPVAVSIADTSLPLGYDIDRLVCVNFESLPEDAPGYDNTYDSINENRRAMESVMNKLRADADVELACNMRDDTPIGDTSISISSLSTGNPATDSVAMRINEITYPINEHYFETYGIKTLPGSPSPEELSRKNIDFKKETIITESLGEQYWPGENALGKRFIRKIDEETGDTAWLTVVAVVEGVRWQSMIHTDCAKFSSWDGTLPDEKSESFTVVVRLRDGADKAEYVNRLIASGPTDFRIGNFYLNSAGAYDELTFKTEDRSGVHSKRLLNYILALFFLINLVLGTVGCFWLQTRKRVEEIGVRRSFGACRGRILGMLVAESVVLASVSFIIGNFIYLQWALKHGLDNGAHNNGMYYPIQNWVSSFPEHFLVVSAIVYAVIIASVIIGTLIPAIKASRVNVTDALRDE